MYRLFGAGLVALLNEGPGQHGLALILYDAGNSDSLVLATVDQAGTLKRGPPIEAVAEPVPEKPKIVKPAEEEPPAPSPKALLLPAKEKEPKKPAAPAPQAKTAAKEPAKRARKSA